MKRHSNEKERGVLIGVRKIREYVGIGNGTFYRLYRDHGLPIMTLPDGRYCTSKTLIDGWIEARWKAQKASGGDA